jgi:hypothetical protein
MTGRRCQARVDQLQGGDRAADGQVARPELLPQPLQGVGELGAVAEAILRIGRHGLAQHREQEIGNIRVVEVQRLIEGTDDLGQAPLHTVGTASGTPAREKSEEDRAHGPHVALGAGTGQHEGLRRGEVGGEAL